MCATTATALGKKKQKNGPRGERCFTRKKEKKKGLWREISTYLIAYKHTAKMGINLRFFLWILFYHWCIKENTKTTSHLTIQILYT